MNAARLAEIEALANAATPGPWEAYGTDIHEDPGDEWIAQTLSDHLAGENAAFIAEARTAVPDLASALREAREVVRVYANHHNFCPALGDDGMETDASKCTCGFADVKETW